MQWNVDGTTITVVQGDITEQKVDAIVNAANSTLLGGGGVDGAIHRRGGPSILEACKEVRAQQGECPSGDAVITTAGELPARHVIHAVGPIWRGGRDEEADTLASAYRRSLEVAVEHDARSIAFPSISTGAYGFPIDQAAAIAAETVVRFVRSRPGLLNEVRMVLFSGPDEQVYAAAFAAAL
jgi:O-acetyl-ADP-ribose deacetylase (regulator of RNase III)